MPELKLLRPVYLSGRIALDGETVMVPDDADARKMVAAGTAEAPGTKMAEAPDNKLAPASSNKAASPASRRAKAH